MRWPSTAVIFAFGAWSTIALAGEPDRLQYTFTIAKDAAGQLVCAKTGGGPQPDAQAVDIKVVAPAPASFAFTLDGAPGPLQAGAGFQIAHIPLTSKVQVFQVTTSATFDIGNCGDPLSLPLAKPYGSDSGHTFSDVAAAAQLGTSGVKTVVKPPPGKHWFSYGPLDLTYLVHLPSGQPAFPSPARLTEGQDVQVVLMVPDNAPPQTLSLQVDGCGDVNTFRTDIAGPITPADGKHAKDTGPPSSFEFLPVGQYFSCGAGTVTYTLKVQAAGATTATTISTTKVTFRPKYHVAAIALLGWDTAQRTTYAADVPAGYSSPVVARRKEKVGVATYVGATWMFGGVDYEDMQWWNYFANLFIAADPANPTKDVVAGISITPTGGAALSVGISYHEGQVLEGLVPGNPVPVGTTFPLHSSWSERGQGLFVGLSIDSRIYDSIIARFTPK